jgi:outer membrane autotransporter protein
MGSYDAHNSFNGYSSVKADGDTNYIGGGILGRFDFANSGPGHFYTEITGRIGRLESDFSSDDLRDSTGVKADYDSSGLYYGAHFGAGYIVNITNKASLDLYGKYLWTHQKGDSITLSNGDPIKFEDASSHRLRGGARLSYAASYRVSPYIGAAYEQEFDGEAKAKTYGQKIDAPKLQGGTGIGEIGLNIRPATGIPLSFDLGVQGYLGVRQGLGGSLQLKYDF